MKRLITLMSVLLLSLTSFAGLKENTPTNKTDSVQQENEALKVTLRYFAETKEAAEAGAKAMADTISKNAKFVSLESKEYESEGKKYWVANLVVTFTRADLIGPEEKRFD